MDVPMKKRGAPIANTNALKHGFYSKRYRAEEKERLDGVSTTDVKSEIAFLRVCMDRLAQKMGMVLIDENSDASGAANIATNSDPADLATTHTKSDVGPTTEQDLKELNTLSNMAQSLATLVRTQHLIHGGKGEIDDAIKRALDEIRADMEI